MASSFQVHHLLRSCLLAERGASFGEEHHVRGWGMAVEAFPTLLAKGLANTPTKVENHREGDHIVFGDAF